MPRTAEQLNTFRPLFIGNFRSGTTLLVNLLGLHPWVAPWFETKALCEPLRWLRVLNRPDLTRQEADLIRLPGPPGFSAEAVAERMLIDFRDTSARIAGAVPSGKAGDERYPIGHDHALYSLEFAEIAVADWLAGVVDSPEDSRIVEATARLINRLGNRHAALAGKPLWVNKTPEIVRFAPELRACLGEVGIVLMIRDGRDVVHSATRLGWGSAEEMAMWWRGMIEETRNASADTPETFLELRYEDLLDNPVVRIDQVLQFMGVPANAADLVECYQRDFPLGRVPSVSTAGRPVPDYIDADFMRSLGYC